MSSRVFSFFAVSLLFISLANLPLSAQGVDDLGVVTKASDSKVFRVSLAASNAEDSKLLKTAFGVHGAYAIVGANDAEFQLQFNRQSANSVECIISSGKASTELKRFTSTGSTPRNALLKAADKAVRLTSGNPGFFAGKMVFVGERERGIQELYTADLFFGELKVHTNDHSQLLSPRWAPSGREVVYTSYYKTGFPDIFKHNVMSGERASFMAKKGTNSGARYSPNGKGIAMVLSATGNPEIYLSNTNGGGIKRLTNKTSIETSPSWKNDGSEIVFTSDTMGRPQLYRMSAGGGTMTRIKTNISRYCSEPDWNPRDSSKIVFTAIFSQGFQTVLWDFKKNECEVLTQGKRDSVEPVWLNDGRHVIITRRTGAVKKLVLLDTITKKERDLHSTRFGKASQADFVYVD